MKQPFSFPPSGPATGSFIGLHLKSKLLAVQSKLVLIGGRRSKIFQARHGLNMTQNKSYLVLMILIATVIGSCSQNSTIVNTWSLPSSFSPSDKFKVTVNGKECPVIHSDPATNTHFAYFDFKGGSVKITVTSLDKYYFLNGCKIKPTSKRIKPHLKGNQATFTISHPCKISVENPEIKYRDTNGKGQNLVILAGEPQTNIPLKDDPSVIYLGPGLHKQNIILNKTGQTLYLDGGAILLGTIDVREANDVKICGRGVVIFDDTTNTHGDGASTSTMSHPLTTYKACNLTVEGIKLVPRCRTWATSFINASGLRIKDIGIFADNRWDMNGDGIDLRGVSDVIISDCFIRSDDDAIAMYPWGENGLIMKNIIVKNCIIWNTASNVVRLSWDSPIYYDGSIIDGFTMRNCEIIHGSSNKTQQTVPKGYPHGLFQSSFVGGNTKQTFKNFTIENIIEDYSCLLVLTVPNMIYQNWIFKNISCDDKGIYQSFVNSEHIEGMIFENLRMGGMLITSPDDANFRGDSLSSKIKFIVTNQFLL